MSTYATIIVLVILTIVIFAFIGFALYSIFKSEKVIVSRKERDQYIIDEQNKNQSKKSANYGKNGKVSSLVFTIIGYVIVIGILVFEGFAVITNSKNQLFYIGSKARLVVASDSMSSIYDDLDSRNQKVENGGNLTSDMIAEEFQVGDILTFTHAPNELDMINYTDTGSLEYTTNGSRYGSTISSNYLNKVFAFQYQNMIVIHRLVKIEQRTSDTTGENFFVYVFSGDKYPTQTQVVTYDAIQGIYTGSKVQGIGYAILFLGSVYGAYSIIGALIIIVATSYFTKRLTKLYASRYEEIIKERFDEEFSNESFNKDDKDVEHERIIEAEEFKVLPAKDHSKETEDEDEISSIKKR